MIRSALRRPARLLRKNVLPSLIPASRGRKPRAVEDIRVVGLLSSATGLGKSARLCVEALAAKNLTVTTADVSKAFAANDGIAFSAQASHLSGKPQISIYHLNPPKLLIGLLRSGISRYRRSYNIGYWAWELEKLPGEWVDGLRFVDAIMVPSRFCRDTMARYTDKPVLVVPHPVHLDAVRRPPPLPAMDSTFRVLSIFSFDSSFERKNPIALVRAFKQAFGDSAEVELILKTTGGSRYPTQAQKLLREIGGAPNIVVKDELWTEDQLDAAIDSASVYASLHRSEGFGLTLAEAALRNVPVVATNWSGNTDFCKPDLCFPVDYTLVTVRDDHPDLSGVEGAMWADASVESAAAQLRAVRASPDAARQRASALRRSLLMHLDSHSYRSGLATLTDQPAVAFGGTLAGAAAA